MADTEQKKKRTFRTFTFKGVDLKDLVELSTEDFTKLCSARVRRRFSRGLGTKEMGFINKLRVARANTEPNEKPAIVKTHLRNMVVVPEMIGSVVGVYNGKVFNTVEIRPEMVGHYLGEFSITYTPVRHGRAGNASSRFIPLR
ncbi:40S ribosomal protein S15 [Scheffersomyces amazonensis]|uniref:40S ribosomal protein S15 n=1 Tax=Scheffersomyces amazonensis TaxID=1078765 RepID=UPI00315C5E24